MRTAPSPPHVQPVMDGGGIRHLTDLGQEQNCWLWNASTITSAVSQCWLSILVMYKQDVRVMKHKILLHQLK